MSDRHLDEDDGARLLRASLSGWQTGVSRRAERASPLFDPGRGRLELAVLLSAAAMLVPVAAFPALVAAVSARRAGNPRAVAACLAAIWCGMLGLVVRGVVNIGPIP